MSTLLPAVGNRIYRSHSQPACIPCRKRKSRCKLDSADSAACVLCKLHGNDCAFPALSTAVTTASTSHRGARKRVARQKPNAPSTSAYQHDPPGENSVQDAFTSPTVESSCSLEVPFAGSTAPASPSDGDASHVVGPVQSPDAQLIANYLFNNPKVGSHTSHIIISRPDCLHSGQRTVLFNAVRRHPLGHISAQSLPVSICEIVTKLLEPHCENIIDVYFSRVHQCFPILDERTFKLQYTTQRGRISPALLTSLYAQSIVYWGNASSASNQHYPDLRFIWNKASETLNSELYASPGMSAIVAILLNVSGRPLTAMIGNGVLLGSAISLAHSLGLNRNCVDWNISSSEKLLRTMLWWAIVICDKWFSVTHGTPQQLRASQHDVPPLPLAAIPDEDRTTHYPAKYSTFEALARLSEVLETYLDHVFNLHPSPDNDNHKMRILLEKKLAQWEDQLSSELRRAILRGTKLSIPGSANLRLAYLYIRLLTQKLGIDGVKQHHPMDSEERDHRLMYARQAAESIVLFVQELDDVALGDFWLSFNAFALSGTAAFLFRCALESEQGAVGIAQSRHLQIARDLVIALQAHQRRMNWDLGNICVAQYATVLENITTDDRPLEAIPDLQQLCRFDLADSDQMFLNEWDMFQTDVAYFC